MMTMAFCSRGLSIGDRGFLVVSASNFIIYTSRASHGTWRRSSRTCSRRYRGACTTLQNNRPEDAEGRWAVDGNRNDVIVNARGRKVIASYTMRNAKLYARLKFDHLVPCPWKGHIEEIARTSSVDSVLLDDLRTNPTSKTPTLMCFSSQRSCCNCRKDNRPCIGVPCLVCEKKDIAYSHYDDPVLGAYYD